MKKKTREYLVKIIGLSYEVNSREKNTMFVDFSGHTNQIDVNVHLNGWKPDVGYDEKYCIYLDREDSEENLKELLKYLKSLKN